MKKFYMYFPRFNDHVNVPVFLKITILQKKNLHKNINQKPMTVHLMIINSKQFLYVRENCDETVLEMASVKYQIRTK